MQVDCDRVIALLFWTSERSIDIVCSAETKRSTIYGKKPLLFSWLSDEEIALQGSYRRILRERMNEYRFFVTGLSKKIYVHVRKALEPYESNSTSLCIVTIY